VALVGKNFSSFGNMSRLGKQPLTFPSGVDVALEKGILTLKGPKGALSRQFTADVAFTLSDKTLTLAPAKETKLARSLWGTYAAHVRNMLRGVTEGFTKVLQIEGVGYRAEVKGSTLVMALGFSHPVVLPIPEGISVTVEKGVVTISGMDKDRVGQFAADIRAQKKPEPYKGKGIRYAGEFIIRKQGKKAA